MQRRPPGAPANLETLMHHTRRFVLAALAASALGTAAGIASAKGKAHHENGKKLLGEKIKANGSHVIHKKGPYTTTVDVKDGKVAGMHVKHATKGEVPVRKYKTTKQLAQAGGLQYASYVKVQDQYLGTTYIGYSYYDEYGDETIYWYPYDMILDGATGAIDYVPVV